MEGSESVRWVPKVMQNAMAKLYVRGNGSEAGEGCMEEVWATG